MEKDIVLNSEETCDVCNGEGGLDKQSCLICNGTGKVKLAQKTMFGLIQTEMVCSNCKGRGYKYTNTCPKCHDIGNQSIQDDIEKTYRTR